MLQVRVSAVQCVGTVVQTVNMAEVHAAIGVFRAVVTRDGAALARSGEPFYERCELPETHSTEPGRLFEIRFGDGRWMLVREGDIEDPSG